MTANRIRSLLGVCLLVVATSTWVAGCQQDAGERCQVNDDCASPLTCNPGTQQCSNMPVGGLDATVPDAPPVDAAVDAPDAAIDAASAIDAPPDAALP